MWPVYICVTCLLVLVSTEEYVHVKLDQGYVKGVKYWGGDYFEFYGIPYASAPTGSDKFKAPLPPKAWNGTLDATNKHVMCKQILYNGDDDTEGPIILGDIDCLVVNVFAPLIAGDDNLLPVVVYIHSGGFSMGHGSMAKYNYLLEKDVVVVSLNFRLGVLGFLCIGTKNIPGNAGLKDIAAALKWVNKNIKKFGGDPDNVSVAGFSVGAAIAEILMLSKSTDGLIHKIILESGTALAPWAIQIDPIKTSRNIAESLSFINTGTIDDLERFYLDTPVERIIHKISKMWIKNSTFVFAPCIEKEGVDSESVLVKHPSEILKSGNYKKLPLLTGYAEKEGISRLEKYYEWSREIEHNFEDFLPVDLSFSDANEKTVLAKIIQHRYFNNTEETPFESAVSTYVDYFSDVMFVKPIVDSATSHANNNNTVFVYQFSYVGRLNNKHSFQNIVKGASHRDQTSYVLDFPPSIDLPEIRNIRNKMTTMWTNFMKYGTPIVDKPNNELFPTPWPVFDAGHRKIFIIDENFSVANLDEISMALRLQFWDEIYEKYSKTQHQNSLRTDEL